MLKIVAKFQLCLVDLEKIFNLSLYFVDSQSMACTFLSLALAFIIQQCISQNITTTEKTTIPIKIGGLFYNNTAQYYAFLRAIDDVNNNPMLLDGYHLEAIVQFHTGNWIIEAANILSRNPTAVIAPPTSQAVKQISPLFTLTTTPLIGYSATASILSDTDIFPYFYRVSPDVSNLIGPILGLFEVCTIH